MECFQALFGLAAVYTCQRDHPQARNAYKLQLDVVRSLNDKWVTARSNMLCIWSISSLAVTRSWRRLESSMKPAHAEEKGLRQLFPSSSFFFWRVYDLQWKNVIEFRWQESFKKAKFSPVLNYNTTACPYLAAVLANITSDKKTKATNCLIALAALYCYWYALLILWGRGWLEWSGSKAEYWDLLWCLNMSAPLQVG